MANGIIIIDKPSGWTSQDVVAKLRGVFHEKRVGHGGTLDPMATGVLPVFVGRATRAVEFFEHAQKAYRATLLFGTVTDTQDTTGKILSQTPVNVPDASTAPDASSLNCTAPVRVTLADLEAVLPRFLGEQLQIPPMYSAIKVKGQKLYEIARRGGEVERMPRNITLYAVKILHFMPTEAILFFRCSKGTYIRTLCHDIGQALGCGGCMSALRREEAGCFTLAQAHTLQEVIAAENPQSLLLPTDTLFLQHPAITLIAAQEKACRNGASFPVANTDGTYRLYAAGGEFLALAEVKNHTAQLIKSFFAPTEE